MEITKEYIALAEAIREAGEPPCATTDPEMYYPPKGLQASIEIRLAKELCKTCPVKTQCLNYAVTANEAFGIWGGMTPNERARLRRN
jgi:WhiB family redox-sensing transcriptional regulator